jgi:hypothetical protein
VGEVRVKGDRLAGEIRYFLEIDVTVYSSQGLAVDPTDATEHGSALGVDS